MVRAWIVFALCVSFLKAGGVAHAGPRIQLDQKEHRFPAVFEGDPLVHTFTFGNAGDTELHITRIESG